MRAVRGERSLSRGYVYDASSVRLPDLLLTAQACSQEAKHGLTTAGRRETEKQETGCMMAQKVIWSLGLDSAICTGLVPLSFLSGFS